MRRLDSYKWAMQGQGGQQLAFKHSPLCASPGAQLHLNLGITGM